MDVKYRSFRVVNGTSCPAVGPIPRGVVNLSGSWKWSGRTPSRALKAWRSVRNRLPYLEAFLPIEVPAGDRANEFHHRWGVELAIEGTESRGAEQLVVG